ncbi:MAG TPA: hypothetical protein VF816_08280 [Rhodocyclaceae bacterium]
MRSLLGCLAALLAMPAGAEVSLYDRGELEAALKGASPCCVVDGRSARERLRSPLKDVLIWSDRTRLKPTGAVVVIADQDIVAYSIGTKIEQRFKAGRVLAVKGGYATWKAMLSASGQSGMPESFVIPSNTCEQGKPLQTLRSNKP